LGQARKARAEHRLSELSKVLQGATTFTFEEVDVPHPGWSDLLFDEMSPEQQQEAQEVWQEASDKCEDAPGPASANPDDADSEKGSEDDPIYAA
jgi:hypothetical protein